MYERLIASLRICQRMSKLEDSCIMLEDGACDGYPNCMIDLMDAAADAIEKLSADVQPVLRCKDCKEWHRNYLAIDGGKHGCELFQDFTRPDDFCSFGTRMEGEA